MKIVVAISAASGAIYARQVIEILLADPAVEQIGVIFSGSAREVAIFEGVSIDLSDQRVVEFGVDDMFAPVASGSAGWSAMIVVPCSVGTVGRIASGVSDSLITRAADVMLKERRPLVLVVREMPLSLIHLRNMTTITEAGGIIMPASPNFYNGASDIETLTLTVSRRAVEATGAQGGVVRWSGKK